MRGTLVLLATLPDGGTAAARLVDGLLDDLLIDPSPADPAPRPGAIHRAIPGRPMKGLGGSIVDLGDGRSGFLRETRGLAPGRPVLVQVAGWAEAGKAAPVTTRLLLKGRFAILSPAAPGLNLARSTPPEERERLEALAARAMAGAGDGIGLILRTASIDADEDAVAADVAALRQALVTLDPAGPAACLRPAPGAAEEARRDWPDPGPGSLLEGADTFDEHGVWEAVAALREAVVPLAGGGHMAIEPTRALTAVDVNTGGETGPAAALKANLAALRALPRELRLRGIGGMVVVDLAPLARHERQRILDAAKAALARDPIATTIAGWTPLGNLELSRRRARRPLADLLAGRGLPVD